MNLVIKLFFTRIWGLSGESSGPPLEANFASKKDSLEVEFSSKNYFLEVPVLLLKNGPKLHFSRDLQKM